MDGNVLGDCSAGTNPGTPCYSVDVADPLATEVGVCDFDPPVADWDGHDEFALGGAVLLVETGSGEADPTAGSGSLYCYGGIGHHPAFGPFTVTDVVLGAGATFTVTSDRIDLLGLGDGCGDFKSDDSSDCVGTCAVTFGPGLDGAYVVYVQGTSGHVVS
jgi:hypothetical protein